MKTGFLLVQLGSPKSPEVKDVKVYLKEFLSDPRLIPNQGLGWKIILNTMILPSRSPKSAAAYGRIFKDGQFPLIRFTDSFYQKVKTFVDETPIEYGYCIGQGPSVKDALAKLKSQGCDHIRLVALYPQYANGTTLGVQDVFEKACEELAWKPDWEFLTHFHDTPAFVEETAGDIQKKWNEFQPDALLISHHGYPKQRIFDGDVYYDHCLQTALLLAEHLPEIPNEKIHLSFQSQFGREAWLEPSTEDTAIRLAKEGSKKLLVVCPAFAVDNLETEEEIALELKEVFEENGGQDLKVVPCLNDKDAWCERFAKELLQKPLPEIKRLEAPQNSSLKIPDQGPPTQGLSEEAKKGLKVIFLILFLDLVGFSIIFPLIPSILEHYLKLENGTGLLHSLLHFFEGLGLKATPFALSTFFGGFIAFIYSFLQFVAAPFLGTLSDRIGRRPVLLLSMLGLAGSYLLWGFAGSAALLLFSRVLGGLAGANISTATSVVADLTTPSTRSKGMAIIGIAFGLGFILGPAIGGISSLVDLTQYFPSLVSYGLNPFSLPAFLSLFLSMAAAHLVFHNFKESLPPEKRGSAEQHRTINPAKLLQIGPFPTIKAATWAHFLFVLSFGGSEFALVFLTMERLGYRGAQNGMLFVLVGFVLVMVQGGYVRRKASLIGERKMALQGLYTIIPGLALMAFAPNLWMMIPALILMAIGSGQIIPCLTTLASKDAPATDQGRILGIFRSLGSLGRALGPLYGGILYWQTSGTVTYLVSALSLLIPVWLMIKLPKEVR